MQISNLKKTKYRYEHLQSEFEQPYFSQIEDFLQQEKENNQLVYPATENILKAFDLTAWDAVKVVILGQDPYHGKWQAMGLSFSVPEWIALPPSLKNIYKELEHEQIPPNLPLSREERQKQQSSGDLSRRAEQWVLLLNSVLTVRAGEPASHSKIGRQTFTDAVIRKISMQKSWIVFMLRWSYAQSKKHLIDISKHHILETVHPSPLSAYRGWFGSNHFTLCNDYLVSQGENPIIW